MPSFPFPHHIAIAIVGRGRLGSALADALSRSGLTVRGPYARDEAVDAADAVILAVPEREIVRASERIPPEVLIGHCSASMPLDALAPRERFNWHPLMTLNAASGAVGAQGAAASDGGGDVAGSMTVPATAGPFYGAVCAIDGSTDAARTFAIRLAQTLGMRAVHVAAEQRALYHAAASMAANYLVTLQDAAASLARHAGITRQDLAPLVRAALESWIAGGFTGAISGPLSRGDDDTVARQRHAVQQSAPDVLPLFDALTLRTRERL